jgi:hypothetical protein
MATITVFSFEIYNDKNGVYERARGMITEKEALKISGARIIETTAKKVDESELTQSKRYYENVEN